jgi:hypothetical protein
MTSKVLLICWLPTTALFAQGGSEVVRLTLDSNTVQRIAVAVDRVTTLSFPVDISGLEGAFISQQPTFSTRFLLSFQPGARYFSLRALATNVSANLNVILGREIYALEFFQSAQPVYVVEFFKPAPRRSSMMPKPSVPAPANALQDNLKTTNANHSSVEQAPPPSPPQPSPNPRSPLGIAAAAAARRKPAATEPAAVIPTPVVAPIPSPVNPQAPESQPSITSTDTRAFSVSGSSSVTVTIKITQSVVQPPPTPPPVQYIPSISAAAPIVIPASYQAVEYRSDYDTAPVPVYRSYYYQNGNAWPSYRFQPTANSVGFSLSFGSLPRRSLPYSRFP